MDENALREITCTLRSLWETYTPELLSDTRRLNALLMDFIPQRPRERKLIISVLREGLGNELLSLYQAADAEACKNTLARWTRRLAADLWITEGAAQFAVDALSVSLGLGEHTAAEDTPQPEKELVKGCFTGTMDAGGVFLTKYESLGYKAFAANNELSELTVPPNIRVIRARAFLNCRSLKKVILPSQLEALGREAFRGCWSLSELHIRGNGNYETVSGMLIDRKRNALLRVVQGTDCVAVPKRVESVSSYAFDRNGVKEIHLPPGLRTLEPFAFFQCSQLERVKAGGANSSFADVDGVLHDRGRTVLVYYPSGRLDSGYVVEDTVTGIADSAFEGAYRLQAITFTGALKTIGRRAFRNCCALQSLILPGSVEMIGERAFQSCTGLGSVMLSRGIREIGDAAFQDCECIQAVSIPRNVEWIGHAAFAGCRRLGKVTMQDHIRFIGDGAFAGCPPELEIIVKDNPYVETYCKAHGMKFSRI